MADLGISEQGTRLLLVLSPVPRETGLCRPARRSGYARSCLSAGGWTRSGLSNWMPLPVTGAPGLHWMRAPHQTGDHNWWPHAACAGLTRLWVCCSLHCPPGAAARVSGPPFHPAHGQDSRTLCMGLREWSHDLGHTKSKGPFQPVFSTTLRDTNHPPAGTKPCMDSSPRQAWHSRHGQWHLSPSTTLFCTRSFPAPGPFPRLFCLDLQG